jgi:tetratricopeptide (TPR) repeat protein/CHAT domain-containing protein
VTFVRRSSAHADRPHGGPRVGFKFRMQMSDVHRSRARVREMSVCNGSGFLVSLVVVGFLSAVGFAGAQSEPSTLPGAGHAPDRPPLPAVLRKTAERAEDNLDNVISRPRSLEQIRGAVPRAEKDLALRRKYQGDNWWETGDAQRRLTDLLQLEKMAPAEFADLTKADSLAEQVNDIPMEGRKTRRDDAIAKGLAAADLLKKIWGEDDPAYASCLDLVAEYYHDLGEYKEAEPLYNEVLRIRLKVLGDRHPDYATSLNNVAELYDDTGRYADAEAYYLNSLEVSRHVVGSSSTDYAIELNNIAVLYRNWGRYAEAKSYAAEAVSIEARSAGRSSPGYAVDLKTLAETYESMGYFGTAERMYNEILAIDRRSVGVHHPTYAIDLNDVGALYKETGRFRAALPLLEQAVKIVGAALGERNETYSTDIGNLASLYEDLGRYEEAERLFVQALAIDRDVLGDKHPEYADDLNNLAELYQTLGRFAEALPLYTEARDVTKESLGEAHPDYALRLNNLAEIYEEFGWYGKAEPLLEQALQIHANAVGKRHPDYATTLSNLGELYDDMGRYDAARPLLENALTITGNSLGKNHPAYALALNNLGGVYRSLGLFNQAEPLYRQALEIDKRTFGEESAPYALTLNDLALIYSDMSQHDKAIQADSTALTIRQNALGMETTDYATSLNNLAEEYAAIHQYNDAERLLSQAIEIERKVLGEESPEYADRMTNLSLILASQGKWEKASHLLMQASSTKWKHLASNLGLFSPEQQHHWLETDAFREGELIWSSVFDGHGTAEEALQAILWRKQLGIEASRQQSAALRNAVSSGSTAWQSEWNSLSLWRKEYSELAMTLEDREKGTRRHLSDPIAAQYLHKLQVRIDETEKKLRQANSAYADFSRLSDITTSDVARALRPGEALVEYVCYREVDFKAATYGDEQYGAIVFSGGDHEPVAVKLGNGGEIDRLVEEYRSEMNTIPARLGDMEASANGVQLKQSEADLGRISWRLRDRIWAPLAPALHGVTRAYVAPDGDLSLIPFEVLASETANGEWQYLAEDLQIVYLGTGRDLVDLVIGDSGSVPKARSAVLIGNPNFHEEPREIAMKLATVASSAEQSRTAAALDSQAAEYFLSGSPRDWYEVPALGEVLDRAKQDLDRLGWSVQVDERDSAIKEFVLSVHSPTILQIATHGVTEKSSGEVQAAWDNPLLHSMLVFAGADRWKPASAVFYRVGDQALEEAEARTRGLSAEQLDRAQIRVGNGVLTAYEVTGMDLTGTDLVNLTACETGLGQVTADGVVGLRQAFRLAGARSIIVSLWQLPADETIAQVTNFYDLWLSGTQGSTSAGRYGAFRAAELAALQNVRKERGSGHPIYWAGTIYLGDPGDLTRIVMIP